MNYLGVAWTVFINYFILAVLVIILLELPKEILYFITLLIIGVLIYIANIYLEQKMFVRTDSYANYQVLNNSNNKILIINDSTSSAINSRMQGFPYIEVIKKILFVDLKLHHKNILVLGAGGFSLSAGERQDNRFTYIDIDPKIKPIVEQHFLAPVKGNFIAQPTLADTYSKRIDNTIRSIFKNCTAIPLEYTERPVNIIYTCKKTSYEKDARVYTDNENRSTLDFFKHQ